MSPNDPSIATKVAIQNSLASESAPDSLNGLSVFIDQCSKKDAKSLTSQQKIFSNLLKALLDLRVRAPPIYNLDPKFIVVDSETCEVQIIISEEMFSKTYEPTLNT